MNGFNPLTAIDFYKAGHRQQYPKGTSLVVSNFTNRSGKHSGVPNKSETLFFGLQYFLKNYLMEEFQTKFFDIPKTEVVAKYKRRMDTSLGPDSIPVDHIEALHDLGYLPLEIRALKEGARVPVGIPLVTIHNTHPDFFWLVNYIETVFSAYVWLPMTSATTAMNFRALLDSYQARTGAPDWFTDFQAHDFSYRGMSSPQSAMTSGAGHLIFFKGTDTVSAIDFIDHYYQGEKSPLVGASVPATEHSVMCMGGEQDELETYRRLITEIYPKGIVSIVSDTWDFWQVITDYSVRLKQQILARDGKLVFRPDSGNPVQIICGTERNILDQALPPRTPAEKGAVECLWDIFGGTITETGHKLLDSHVGLIYGDSISYERAQEILKGLEAKGFSSGNIVFGVGSFTYQYVTRDTWGSAMKATYGVVNNEAREIYKNPKTDDGTKKSAKGLLHVARDTHILTQGVSWEEFTSESNALTPVWKDGKLLKDYTIEEIRATAKGV